MKEEFNKKIQLGIKWNILNQIFTQVIFLIFGLYLARLLGPEAYGLIGMITIFAGIANLIIDFGFSSSIIYFDNLTLNKLSSLFWFNIFIALILYMFFFIGAPLLSDFYHEARLTALTRVITISILFSSISTTLNAMLSRRLDFKFQTIFSWVAKTVGYLFAFYFAWIGYGVWSIVFQTLISSFLTMIFLYVITKWKPLFYFKLSDIKEIFSYSSGIFGTNLFSYSTRNADNLMIGKMLGEEALGLYSRSYSLMMLPITNISTVFSKVFFPVFSTLKSDKKKIKTYYLLVIKIIAFISFPIMFGLFSIAQEFVMVFLGEDWIEIIQYIKILCFLGASQSILSLNGVIFNSIGKSGFAFKITVVSSILMLPFWYFGILWDGLLGLVYAYTLFGMVWFFPALYIAVKSIGIHLIDVLKILTKPFLGSLLIIVSTLFINIDNYMYGMFLKIFIGALVYTVYSFFIQKKTINFLYRKFKI